ncbi:MAG: hypothetical protein DMG65_06655 [Candidatus Angelobacter sp. Gp1-AA117]|nr:MAG: hypothetical protein DMG65_06655 [Candidatus Angelobacter sp. Gp1-AA117]
MATSKMAGPLNHYRHRSVSHHSESPAKRRSQLVRSNHPSTIASSSGNGIRPTPLFIIEQAMHPWFPSLFPLPPTVEMALNAALLLPAPNPTAPQIAYADFQKVAKDLDIEVAAIQAVAEVEAGPRKRGFDSKGRPIILFEGHKFHKYTHGQFDLKYPQLSYLKWTSTYYGLDQWNRMYQAMMLDYEAAWQAASWGIFQSDGI